MFEKEKNPPRLTIIYPLPEMEMTGTNIKLNGVSEVMIGSEKNDYIRAEGWPLTALYLAGRDWAR